MMRTQMMPPCRGAHETMTDTRSPALARGDIDDKQKAYQYRHLTMVARLVRSHGPGVSPLPFVSVDVRTDVVVHLKFTPEERGQCRQMPTKPEDIPVLRITLAECERVVLWLFANLWSHGIVHGDLTGDNFAVRNGDLYILDWEVGLFGYETWPDISVGSTVQGDMLDLFHAMQSLCGVKDPFANFGYFSETWYEEDEEGYTVFNEAHTTEYAKFCSSLAAKLVQART